MKCCFIGYVNSLETKNKIYTTVKHLIESGVTSFYSRGRKCDTEFERAVKKCKGKLMLVPHNLNKINNKIISWYDDIVYPKRLEINKSFDISIQYCYMVEYCDICICNIEKDDIECALMEYAEKQNKRIISL